MRAKFGGNNLAKRKLRDVQQSFDESLAELMDSVNKTGKMTEAGNGKGKKAKAEEPAIIPGKREVLTDVIAAEEPFETMEDGIRPIRPEKYEVPASLMGRTFINAFKDFPRNSEPSVKIIPLGGLDRIGMNITAFEYGEDIIVVDCGVAFPEDDMLGVDLGIRGVT